MTKLPNKQEIKTCANSLRPFYVSKIFPTAKFIYIVRDGRRVVMSAEKKWKHAKNGGH